jgi:hypothetical protein
VSSAVCTEDRRVKPKNVDLVADPPGLKLWEISTTMQRVFLLYVC